MAAAPKGKARARRRRRAAQPQRYLKAKHARLVLGALRSPRLMIFLLCEHQPLEGLRCYGGRTVAMVARIEVLRWPHGGHGACASARADYGVRWWAWPPGARASAELFAALHRARGRAERGSRRVEDLCGSRVERREAEASLSPPFLSADLMVAHWRGAELERSMK